MPRMLERLLLLILMLSRPRPFAPAWMPTLFIIGDTSAPDRGDPAIVLLEMSTMLAPVPGLSPLGTPMSVAGAPEVELLPPWTMMPDPFRVLSVLPVIAEPVRFAVVELVPLMKS